jgi:RNA polymerase sigma factor (sigma-70 family)
MSVCTPSHPAFERTSAGERIAIGVNWVSNARTRCYSLLGLKTAAKYATRCAPATPARAMLATGVQRPKAVPSRVRRANLGSVQAEAVPIAEFLLHRVSRGDAEAVRECIARFGGLIWTLARRVGLPENESEDAVHEIFTELWKHGHKYDPTIASETAFVATIARRRLIDRRRRVSRQPAKQQIIEESAPAPGGASSQKTFVAEEAARAEQALTQLTNEQQRVLRLSVYEGLSHELIARSTGMPLGTVKTHARRGLIKLREMLGVPQPVNGDGNSDGSSEVKNGGAQ